MNDMSAVIVPKSDQVNAEDFIAGPVSYTIEGVAITPGTEQPVSIKLAGEKRVWRPCKSMSRVLVAAWGPDAKAYVGRSVTLYRDPTVKWGGMEVGGIRVSHMSDIERDMVMALTATKGKRALHTVRPLRQAHVQPIASSDASDAAKKWADAYITKLPTLATLDSLAAFESEKAGKLVELQTKRPELYETVTTALRARYDELTPNDGTLADDNPAATEGRDDDDFGEPFDGDRG